MLGELIIRLEQLFTGCCRMYSIEMNVIITNVYI